LGADMGRKLEKREGEGNGIGPKQGQG